MARYLGGLWRDIQDVVTLQPFNRYNEVYKLAVKVEKQQRQCFGIYTGSNGYGAESAESEEGK